MDDCRQSEHTPGMDFSFLIVSSILNGIFMMKKIWIFLFLSLFIFVTPSLALEYKGRTITAQDIKNLPPGTIEQVKQAASSEQNVSIQDALLKEPTLPKNEETTNKLTMKQGAAATVSIIEQQYRKGYSSSLSSNLKQFGYDIFGSAKTQPTSLALPDPGYLLGTGDQLLIRLWGSNVDAEYVIMVNREGTISVPKIGIIHLAGVRYGNIESIIRKEAQKYIQGINLSVTLTKLRSLEIYVVGAVNNPGLHILPSFSTIFDGLLAAGGVKKSGTLRKIKLNRAKKQMKALDIYDLLLKGSRGGDAILQNKDVIFVPGIGKTAAVAGAVNNEAIFELKKEKNVNDLVKIAGGLLPQAFGSRIYLRRFENNQSFIINDIDSASIAEWEKVSIQNGDLVELTFSSSLLPNVVRLEGHIRSPDVFNFRQGMKLSQILTSPTLLMPDAVTEFALLYRYDTETTRTTPHQFPLLKVFTGEYDALLHPFDEIRILSKADIGIREDFEITGAVWKPGQYEYKTDLRLKDALALAGGMKFGARTQKIEIARQEIKGDWIQIHYISLDYNKDLNFILKPYDSILVPRIKNASLVEKVTITGEVAYPGTYSIRHGEKVSDLIKRAGGFSKYAYFYGAKYTSQKARAIQQKSIDQMIEKLKLSIMQSSSTMAQTAMAEEDVAAAKMTEDVTTNLLDQLSTIKADGRVAISLADLSSFKDSLYDFRLKDGDTIDIPPKPSFISVVGSVYSPGSFLYEPNRDLDFYLAKSGGTAKTADEDYIYLLKANGEIFSISQSNSFFSKFGSTVLMAGDTIVVPEDLERVPYLKLISDIADIAFKIATTAGVAIAIGL